MKSSSKVFVAPIFLMSLFGLNSSRLTRPECVIESYEKQLNSTLNQISGQIINDIKPSQVLIMTMNEAKLNQSYSLIQRHFTQLLPILKFDARNKQSFITAELSILKRLRKDAALRELLIIIILKQDHTRNSDDAQILLSLCIQPWPTPTRPKIIIILLEATKDTRTKKISEFLLILAWRNKILDFSILYIFKNLTKSAEVSYYQPFFKKISSSFLNSGNLIFPNKLKNMNRYKFRLAIPNKLKYNKVRSLYKQMIIQGIVRGGDYYFVNHFFAKALNFQIQVIEYRNSSSYDMIHGDFAYIKQHKRFALAQPVSLYYAVAAIPKLRSQQSFTFQLMTMFFFILVGIITFYLLVAKIFKLPQERWRWIKIYATLFEDSMNPDHLIEKVTYLFLIATSMFLSNQLLSDVSDMSLGSVQETVDSFEGLLRLNLTIHAADEYVFDGAPQDVKRLLYERTKFHFVNRASQCWQDLAYNNDRICIDQEENFDMHRSHLARYEGIILHKANFYLATDLRTQAFPLGSEYLQEFEKIHLRSIQAGFIQFLGSYRSTDSNNLQFTAYTTDEITSDSAGLVVMLCTVVMFGLALSTVTFVGEILTNFIKTGRLSPFARRVRQPFKSGFNTLRPPL